MIYLPILLNNKYIATYMHSSIKYISMYKQKNRNRTAFYGVGKRLFNLNKQ